MALACNWLLLPASWSKAAVYFLREEHNYFPKPDEDRNDEEGMDGAGQGGEVSINENDAQENQTKDEDKL